MSISAGQKPSSSEVLQIAKVEEVYAGSSFDSTVSGASQTQSNSHELTAIAASKLVDANYVKVTINVDCNVVGGSGDSQSQLKIESKEVGGSYSDTLANTVVFTARNGTAGNWYNGGVVSLVWTHTLSAGEKTNGVQFKITSTSVTSTANASNTPAASTANVQTILEVKP